MKDEERYIELLLKEADQRISGTERKELEELRDNLNARALQLQQNTQENWEELKANVENELKEAKSKLEK